MTGVISSKEEVVISAFPLFDGSSSSVDQQEEFHHSLYFLKELRARNASWHSFYFLNPSMSFNDFWLGIQMCVLLVVLRLLLSGAYHKNLRKWPSFFKILGRKIGIVKQQKCLKFSENLWYSIWHTSSFLVCTYILFLEGGSIESPGWSRMHLYNPDGRWYWLATNAEYSDGHEGWPLIRTSELVKIFYVTQIAFWISCLLFLSVETIRKDVTAMVFHHTATVILLVFSFICSYWRLGLAVIFLHDVVDIFLYSAKTFHYARMPDNLVNSIFIMFTISYLIARLLLFPVYCVWPALNIWSLRYLSKGYIQWHWDVPGGVFLLGFLGVLLALILVEIPEVMTKRILTNLNFRGRSQNESVIFKLIDIVFPSY